MHSKNVSHSFTQRGLHTHWSWKGGTGPARNIETAQGSVVRHYQWNLTLLLRTDCDRIASIDNNTRGEISALDELYVTCDNPKCLTKFYLRYGKSPHTPLSCKILQMWDDQKIANASNSETAHWVNCCPRYIGQWKSSIFILLLPSSTTHNLRCVLQSFRFAEDRERCAKTQPRIMPKHNQNCPLTFQEWVCFSYWCA